MEETEVTVSDDLIWDLHDLFFPNDSDNIRFKVDMFDGLRIVMHFDEHPPPHFAVKFQDEKASFSIAECERLRGNKGLERHEAKIRKWWSKNKNTLKKQWNGSRPADCPVGLLK